MRVETLRLLRCPTCKRGELQSCGQQGPVIIDERLRCKACNQQFPVEDGIPIFLPEALLAASSTASFSSVDESTRQKVLQREWHDRAHMDKGDGYKQTAYAGSGLFSFLLYYQLREVQPVLATKAYSMIANVCCGQGFELEYLSLLGKNIIVADISPKSVQRAIRLGESLGLCVDGICCDAENLPLRDDACDLVITHHSLHHLAKPMSGMEEMVRISSGTVAFFEPAKGVVRSLVRAIGLKPAIEESGNKVYEFGYRELCSFCEQHGVTLRYFRKSLVSGPTTEPIAFKRLDKTPVTPLLCTGITTANRLFGRVIGTKCSVVMDKRFRPTLNGVAS